MNVRHTLLWVEEEAKKKYLFNFLKDKETFWLVKIKLWRLILSLSLTSSPPVVVFVNSRKGTLLLAEAIDKVSIVKTFTFIERFFLRFVMWRPLHCMVRWSRRDGQPF